MEISSDTCTRQQRRNFRSLGVLCILGDKENVELKMENIDASNLVESHVHASAESYRG